MTDTERQIVSGLRTLTQDELQQVFDLCVQDDPELEEELRRVAYLGNREAKRS